MSTQEIAALITSVNTMTATVAGKMGQIDQKTAENTAKVDSELAKVLTKLPRIIITRNQVLDIDPSTGLPFGMSVNASVTVTEHLTIIQNNVRPAEQLLVLQQMEEDIGANLGKTAYYRRPFKIMKVSWVNNPGWLLFPQAADDPSSVSIPVNTFITLGAFVKVLSGGATGSWAQGSELGTWVFCNQKLSPAGFGAYANLHPIPLSASGEMLIALPAAITGHIDRAEEWFANVNLVG
ncbi:hypothetical protein HNW13_000250 [Shewanella sp. BF02_Schw]|uniref:hypothetical protein n=1 Tax=Shewanella sp. BF02_Schw TaxID=394908 RepID=UPI0017803A61|nr:hypothetical protein [Shewanella sp. BF02_Schw]MBO1894236.1 hypothetical protein [Shewanella sp. BF02_Schw]